MPPPAVDPGSLREFLDRLLRARQVLGIPPFEPPGDDPPLSRVLQIAEAALARLADSTAGRRLPHTGPPRIALARLEHRVIVLSAGAREEDVVAFVAGLRTDDQRLRECVELIGLLLVLGTEWAAAGFAVPAVLTSLRRAAPRIVALGRDLALDLNSATTDAHG